MNVILALEEIEKAAQGNARLDMLKRCDEACGDLRKTLFLALSPTVTFGIKKLPKPQKRGIGPVSDDQFIREMFPLLGELRDRVVTGNDAQLAVSAVLGLFTPVQLKWAERIIKQDLRLNLGAKDVNNALGANTVPLFEVPLATDYAKVKEKDLRGVWFYQPKLDGARAVAVLPPHGGRVVLLSRTGKEWGSLESIRSVLQSYNTQRDGDDTLHLDGEVVSLVNGRINFQAIQKVMMAKDGREIGELNYFIFDAATASEWSYPQLAYSQRLEQATKLAIKLNNEFSTRIQPIPSDMFQDPSVENLRTVCEKFVAQGFEGAMIRRANLPVENKRSKSLLKVKTFQDAEAVVEGMVEGTGKLQGSLGALVCRTAQGQLFEIGTGFEDSVRMELWNLGESIKGQTANFKFFELTNDGIPRFPVFRSLRSPDDFS